GKIHQHLMRQNRPDKALVLCQADLVTLTAASFTRWLRCLNPHLATAKFRLKRLASRQNSPAFNATEST
ncbi:MAG: hypothetical protein AB8H12_12630, partial [Lewinella sp.]